MILFYIITITAIATVAIAIYDKISTYYFVKSLSLEKLQECVNKCNAILEEINKQENFDVEYADEILDQKEMYEDLIRRKQKQLRGGVE